MLATTFVFALTSAGLLSIVLLYLGMKTEGIKIGLAALIVFISGLILPHLLSSDNNSPDEMLAGMPVFAQEFLKSLSPEEYVEREQIDVGQLKALTLEGGILTDLTTIETTEGIFTVIGVVKATNLEPVVITGTNDDRLTDMLCIGDEHDNCYKLYGYGGS